MVTINNNHPVNIDPNLDTQTDQGELVYDNVTGAPISQVQVQFPSDLHGVANVAPSAFEGVKSAAGSNVLNTPPPALGGGKLATSADMAEVLARIEQLMGKQPLKAGLVDSTERGTAPAVPKADATQATPESDKGAKTSKAVELDLDARSVNVDMSTLDKDVAAESAKISEDATKTKKGACKKETNVGEKALAGRLQKMGLSEGQSKTLAKFLNDKNTGGNSNHSAAEEGIVTAAIATYDKLNGANNKAAAGQIVAELKSVADNFYVANKDAGGAWAYYKGINALGNYALQGSADATIEALTSTSTRSIAKIVPYPTVVLE